MGQRHVKFPNKKVCCKMKSKKGIMLMNWILIFLVGAVIIVFAVVFVGKISKVEQHKQNVVSEEYLDLLFNPFSSVGGTTEGYGKSMDLPYEINVNFSCVNGEERLFVGSNRGKKLENFVYASNLKTKKLSVFTKSFKLPFRVADLIYAFDSSQEFCLVYSNSDSESYVLAKSIKEDIESNLGEVRIDLCDSLNCCYNLNNPKIISLNPSVSADVNIIGQGIGEKFAYGKVYFKNEPGESNFIGTSLIEAAIFSSKDIYDCNFVRLMKRVSDVSKIYEKKAGFLQKAQACSYDYIINQLQGMRTAINSENWQNLYLKATEVRQINKGLTCVPVY